VDPRPIYIQDGTVYTAAGVTSALDLALAFVQEDQGADVARIVSRHLVTYLHRPGDQSQISMFTGSAPPDDEIVRSVVDYVTSHLASELSTDTLAAYAGISARHLTRLFTTHMGVTPGRYVRRTRTEAAANLLKSTRLPLPELARRCGLGSSETLRRAFAERFGVLPSQYRATQSGVSG
jgi:transcriptional regulator GlxA family with amidase domain